VIDTTVSEQHTGRGMTFPQDLLSERQTFLSALGTGKRQILAGREVSRVHGHEVQEFSFVLGVAKVAEVLDAGFSELHKFKDSESPS
jgi:hypothetical protein